MEAAYLKASDGNGEAVRATVVADREIGSMELNVDTTLNWPDKFIATVGTLDSTTGTFDPETVTVFYGYVTGGYLQIEGFAPGYSDIGNTENQVVVLKPTTAWADALADSIEDLDGRVLPAGGTTGQALIKSSDADYAVEWGGGARDALSPEIQFAGGKVGIGKVPENGALDVDGDIYSNGAKVAIEDDTGWITPTLLSPFKVYDATAGLVVPVRYRRIRSVVYLEGTLQPTSASTNIDTSDGNIVFTLPEGFRPSTDSHVWVCQGSNRALWILRVDRSGNVYAARYRTDWASYSEPGTTAWFPFSVSFVVD